MLTFANVASRLKECTGAWWFRRTCCDPHPDKAVLVPSIRPELSAWKIKETKAKVYVSPSADIVGYDNGKPL
jgi:hypothetical protein